MKGRQMFSALFWAQYFSCLWILPASPPVVVWNLLRDGDEGSNTISRTPTCLRVHHAMCISWKVLNKIPIDLHFTMEDHVFCKQEDWQECKMHVLHANLLWSLSKNTISKKGQVRNSVNINCSRWNFKGKQKFQFLLINLFKNRAAPAGSYSQPTHIHWNWKNTVELMGSQLLACWSRSSSMGLLNWWRITQKPFCQDMMAVLNCVKSRRDLFWG